MAIDRGEVDRIAALARLEIPEAERARVAAQLSAALDYFEALRQLDLADCAPTAFAPVENPLRDDVPDGRTLPVEAALRAAPEAEDGFFLVPPIVEHLEP